MFFLPPPDIATGGYVPLSSSTPIFFGGLVRRLVNLYLRKKYAAAKLIENQLAAEGDKSAGVLMASGYIAGLAEPNQSAAAFQRALAAFILKTHRGRPRIHSSKHPAWTTCTGSIDGGALFGLSMPR